MINEVPNWMKHLEDEDVAFIKNLLLASGSLKEVAVQYDVTYPTVRLRLDRLIAKIKLTEDTVDPDYVLMIKGLVVDKKISYEAGKLLIQEYRKEHEL